MSSRRSAVLPLTLLAVAVAGCGPTRPDTPAAPGPGEVAAPVASGDVPSAPITNTDPCATRLHDLSGSLLLYQLLNNRAPDTLADLVDLDAGPAVPEAVCPVSGRPYVYRPGGIYLQDRDAHVVIHDPAPSHSGMRWAVTYRPPAAGGPPVTKVIALPESFFLLHPPG